jgi:hypothetical protein
MEPERTVFGLRPQVLEELAKALMRLLAIGLLAIGVSSIPAALMGAIWGASFVAGDPPGVTYTQERCRDLFEYAPGAASCEQAAAEHHFAETVAYRTAAGVAGLVAAGGAWWWLRRKPSHPSSLPVAFEATVGATAFGFAGVVLVALAFNALLVPGEAAGVGAPLSAAIVSLAMATWFGVRLLRSLRPS